MGQIWNDCDKILFSDATFITHSKMYYLFYSLPPIPTHSSIIFRLYRIHIMKVVEVVNSEKRTNQKQKD